MSKEKRLGRGLAALLGTMGPEESSSTGTESPPPSGAETAGKSPSPVTPIRREKEEKPAPPLKVFREQEAPEGVPGEIAAEMDAANPLLQLQVDLIDENPFQPRREFNAEEIDSLSASLEEHDMLQPVLVRRAGDRYQLISGERRLRAARLAKWKYVPAQIREADDRLVAELAIVENLQRKDLNPIEKALSFRRYLDQHRCTQEDLARRLKIDRSTIANLMRLLELPQQVSDAVRDGKISAGHARALLPLGEESLQIAFAERIRREGLSVRATEQEVQARIRAEDEPFSVKRRSARTLNQQIASLEQELRTALGTKVDIKQTGKGRGRIVIQFRNHEEFERLRSLLIEDPAAAAQRQAG